MPRNSDIEIYTTIKNGAVGSNPVVQTPAGVLYRIFITNNSILVFSKSSDGGLSWANTTTINSNSTHQTPAVWYDKWSGLAGGLIHIAYTNAVSHDTYYRTIDTENSDTLSTETTIFNGASAAANGSSLSITRAAGGNVYCRTCIDNGVEGGFYRLPNANVPNGAWDAARTVNEALASSDQMILLPDLNSADNQDILGIFWDQSVPELSRQNYDDSANTWAETSISTGINFGAATTAHPHYAATVDLANNQHVVIAWNATDAANQDLLCWTVTASAITAKTDVVTNGTDDQGLAAIGIDTVTGYWYAFYAGKSDGSETWNTDINVYYKVSQDSGSTWGAETRLTQSGQTYSIINVYCVPRFAGKFAVAWLHDHSIHDRQMITVPVSQPRTQSMLGV